MVRLARTLSLLSVFSVLLAPSVVLGAPLRSIFDLSSRSPAQPDYHKLPCPDAPSPLRSLNATSFYKPGTGSSVITKKLLEDNKQAIAPLKELSSKVSEQSDNYLASGRRDGTAARCVMSLLDSWASADALSDEASAQGKITIVFTLPALTLDYLIVRNDPSIDAVVRARVVRWFDRLGKQADEFSAGLRNNIAYWADASAMGAAIAADNKPLFNSALNRARKYGIYAIREDGSLAREVARRERAMGYHTVALTGLSMVAEFAYANNVDLYKEKGARLRVLIDLVTRNYDHPRDFERMTGEQQTWYPDQAGHLAWAEPAFYRFHNQLLGAILSKHRPIKEPNSGGNVTLMYATLPQ